VKDSYIVGIVQFAPDKTWEGPNRWKA